MGLYEDAQRAKTEQAAKAAELDAVTAALVEKDQRAVNEFVSVIHRLGIAPVEHRFVESLNYSRYELVPLQGWGLTSRSTVAPCSGVSGSGEYPWCRCPPMPMVGIDGRVYFIERQPRLGSSDQRPIPAQLPRQGLQSSLVQTLAYYMP
ncbi:MAG: hypothetical protein JWN03_3826 [Nocardia sp.]|uniref:hypothetical protein n=1 Tax=Nocardia sp. TaxID=1821 RepID=UPI002604AD9B|nr:hypothetical protein [Nocardia sp.]MCU1643551.1 hypothetical protein [Nocardia sp.]